MSYCGSCFVALSVLFWNTHMVGLHAYSTWLWECWCGHYISLQAAARASHSNKWIFLDKSIFINSNGLGMAWHGVAWLVTALAWDPAWLECTGCTICWTIFGETLVNTLSRNALEVSALCESTAWSLAWTCRWHQSTRRPRNTRDTMRSRSNLHANIGGPFQGAGAKCI